ncbi:MAG TPA: TIGR03435 family protein, partial [Candidatus Sulfopaludibacter sp.]|nr:TIGR03435 family protein [Candidatus Sulfopaludibacter sp.]
IRAMAAAALATAAFAQSAGRPKFEVASVKASAEARLTVRVMPGGRLSATAPVKLLIMNAYGLQRSEIVGGPDWINTDRYEIDAKAGDDANRARLMLMLQSLLEERFGLRAHHETRESPVYALVVAKRGSKLTRNDGGCPGAQTSPPRGGSEAAAPACGQIRISPSTSGVRMEGDQAPISELVRVLAVVLNQPVIDRTDLPGTFDIRLQFIDEVPGAPLSDPVGPTVFIALQEQLGLKLESATGPVDFLVIDHIERPSAN